MSKFQSLSREEYKQRKGFLINEIGLSPECVTSIGKMSSSLCSVKKALNRLKNLQDLGFDPAIDFIENDPTLIVRRSGTVQERFFIAKNWMECFDGSVDIHELFRTRPQLWSVGRDKFHVVFLLVKKIKGGVTPERICNIITVNLENLLITFAINREKNCKDIYRIASNVKNKGIRREIKQGMIINLRKKLPKEVYEEYHSRFLEL